MPRKFLFGKYTVILLTEAEQIKIKKSYDTYDYVYEIQIQHSDNGMVANEIELEPAARHILAKILENNGRIINVTPDTFIYQSYSKHMTALRNALGREFFPNHMAKHTLEVFGYTEITDESGRTPESSQKTTDDSLLKPITIDGVNPISPTICRLMDRKITTRPNFVRDAREDTFTSLNEAFSESHVVFLHGLGGIGKSEIAKHWAIQKKQEGMFDTVVFAQLNTEENNSNVMSLLNDDTVFVITGDFCNRGDIFSAGREETAEEYFQRKLARIMKICDEKTLIIIDNYDIADPYLAKLFPGTYRLLVTTRNEYDGINYPFIHVEEIQDIKHLKTIFFNNLCNERDDISYDDPYIERLFELVSNHTLAIEIIAKSLADSVEDTPKSLYSKMVDVGMHAVDGKVESYVSQKALSPSECIQILFNLSRLESDSDFEYKVQVLSFMAAMPTRGLELGLFKKWSNNKTNRAAKALIKKSWLREDIIDSVPVISMHPLIREIVWHEMEPSVEKCHDYLLQMAKSAYGAWRRDYRDNLIIANAITAVLNNLSSPSGKYQYIFDPFIGLLWQVGQFNDAISYAHHLYDSCVEEYGTNSMPTGVAAKALGGCYFNCRRLEDSISWYERGLESMLASGVDMSIDIALAYEKVARCYTWTCNQDFTKATDYFRKANDLYNELLSSLRNGNEIHYTLHQLRSYSESNILTSIGGLEMEMGRMHQLLGNWDEALRLAKDAYDMMNEHDPENVSSIAYTMFDQGVCLYNIGIANSDKDQSVEQLKQALAFLKKALDSNLHMRGELAIDTVDNHEMIGDVCVALGMMDEARREYQTAVHTLENLFGTDCEEANAISAKLHKYL